MTRKQTRLLAGLVFVLGFNATVGLATMVAILFFNGNFIGFMILGWVAWVVGSLFWETFTNLRKRLG